MRWRPCSIPGWGCPVESARGAGSGGDVSRRCGRRARGRPGAGRGREARRRGRVGLRQVHAGPGSAAAAAARGAGRRGDPAGRRGRARDEVGPSAGGAVGGCVDRLPGRDALAERRSPRRRPDRRADPAAPQGHGGRCAQEGRGAAGAGGTAGRAGAGLPARVVRRPAPAGDDRDGAGLRPASDRRRRTDHGARRDDPGADPAADRGPGGRAGRRPDHDQPRPRGAGRHLRPARGDVRGPRGRGGPGPTGLRRRPAPLRPGPVGGVPQDRRPRLAVRPARPSGRPSRPVRGAARVRVPPALPGRAGPVRHGGPALAADGPTAPGGVRARGGGGRRYAWRDPDRCRPGRPPPRRGRHRRRRRGSRRGRRARR